MKRLLIAALLLATGLAPSLAQTTNAAPATNAVPPAPAVPVSDVIPSSEILSRSDATLDRYPAPGAEPTVDPTEAAIRDEMNTMEPKLLLFTGETTLLLAHDASIENVTAFEKWGSYFSATIGADGSSGGWSQQLDKRNTALGSELTVIDAERKRWDDTAAAAKKDPTLTPYAQQIATVQTRLGAARRDTVARQQSLLRLQQRAAVDGAQINEAMTALESARTQAISRLFEVNAPPVWSLAPMPEDAGAGMLTWSRQLQNLWTYVAMEPARFLAHMLLLFLLTGAFWWLRGYARRLAQEEPGIAPAAGIFESPLATALLLSLGASPLLYYPIAPRLLYALLGAAALVPSVVLLRRLIEPRLFPILYALVLFFLLEELRSVASLSVPGARLFLLAEILAAVAFLAWLLLRLNRPGSSGHSSHAVRISARVAMAVLAGGWLAEVLGFTLIANLLGTAVQRSATLALALYAGIRIVEAIFFIVLRLRPLSALGMVRLHGPVILHRLQRMLVWTAVVVWFLALIEQLPWASDIFSGVRGFFANSDPHHPLTLTWPGRILLAVFVVWAIHQTSRFVRFALETDFYPRLRLSAGIPYAISMSLHYVLLTVSFIVATAVLGFDMTKFTILVSAFGVGIGFGLQNIINNFVSGLILLFERPVKIGDTILTGTDTGTVERIGIRASVLRTASGTEVIVPNGTLISSNVTNWTLSSRERIILIPLNVPRGPDPAHVIRVLTAAAAAHPLILKQPAPQVIAQTLGPNLGLELRAWTGPAADWTAVRSELVLTLSTALVQENIPLA